MAGEVTVDFENEKLQFGKKEIETDELYFSQLGKEDLTFLQDKGVFSAEQVAFELSVRDGTGQDDARKDGVKGRHLFASTTGETPFYICVTPKKSCRKVEFDCKSAETEMPIHIGILWCVNADGGDYSLEISGDSYTGRYSAGNGADKIKKMYLRCSEKGSEFDNFVLVS